MLEISLQLHTHLIRREKSFLRKVSLEMPRLARFILLSKIVIQLHKALDLIELCKAEC
jgi:hypothetical protein